MTKLFGRGLLGVLNVAAMLIVASFVIFVLCNLLPGDVAQVMLGQDANPQDLARVRQQLGLDRPFTERYFGWVTAMLHGDFGTSALSGLKVSDQLISRGQVTLSLIALAMLISLIVSYLLGTWAALRRTHADGVVISMLSQIGLAVPAFWAGIMLVLVFAVGLHWFPANGYRPITAGIGPWLWYLALPAISLALVQTAVLTRYVRSEMIEISQTDYFRTAQMIGQTRFGAAFSHGLRNASINLSTVIGLQLATTMIGAVVIEQVFTLPGLGQLLLSAVQQRDLIIVQAVVMTLVGAVIIINAVVDLLHRLIDPRLRLDSEPVQAGAHG